MHLLRKRRNRLGRLSIRPAVSSFRNPNIDCRPQSHERLAILGLGLSTKALTWVLAAWIIVRVGFEVWCAIVAPLTRIRVLFALAAIVDLVLVAFLVTHTTGSVSDLALVGGSIVAVWGMITLVIGMVASKVDLITAAGPRLLQNN